MSSSLLLLWAFTLALALVLGSFLNVCISRLPGHHSIVLPASHCPRCLVPVCPLDNLPVLSWLMLQGRCRACGQPISIRHPLVEAGYAALVAACVAKFGFTAQGAAGCIFCFLLLGLLVMDLETMLLPDAFTMPGLVLGLGWAVLSRFQESPRGRTGSLQEAGSALPAALLAALPAAMRDAPFAALLTALLSGAAWALLLLALRWSYFALRRRHGLGAGDVKLAAMLGAWLGLSGTAVAFFLGVVGAAVVGLVLTWAGRGRLGAPLGKPGLAAIRLPLGAFLCAGSLYALFYGQQTLQWYLRFWPQT